MTGLGKYQRGLELEAEGLDGAAIALKLGYKSTQAWYAAKNYYKKYNEGLNARAACKLVEAPQKPQELLEAAPEARKEPGIRIEGPAITASTTKAEITEKLVAQLTNQTHGSGKPKSRLKVTSILTAEGQALRYRVADGRVSIRRQNNDKAILVLEKAELLVMLEELKELMGV